MSKLIIPIILFSTAYAHSASVWLGFVIEENIEENKGLRVTRVIPNSPAAIAQVKAKDQILAINKINIKDMDDFFEKLKTLSPNQEFNLTLKHQGKILDRKLTPISPPSDLEKLTLMFKNRKLPELKTTLLFKNQVPINKLMEKKSKIIMFWATWCPSCHLSFEKIASLTKEQKENFLFLSDESIEKLKKHLKKKKIDIDRNQFFHLSDNSEFYLINSLPTFMKFNQNQIVERISIGSGTGLNKMISE